MIYCYNSSFPLKEPELLRQWLENMGFNLKQVSAHSKLCSNHFRENCFLRSGGKAYLHQGSVPTIFGDYKFSCIYCRAVKGAKHNEKERTFHKWVSSVHNFCYPAVKGRFTSFHYYILLFIFTAGFRLKKKIFFKIGCPIFLEKISNLIKIVYYARNISQRNVITETAKNWNQLPFQQFFIQQITPELMTVRVGNNIIKSHICR